MVISTDAESNCFVAVYPNISISYLFSSVRLCIIGTPPSYNFISRLTGLDPGTPYQYVLQSKINSLTPGYKILKALILNNTDSTPIPILSPPHFNI